MTVSQLIDLLWEYEGDEEIVFLTPQDTAAKLDEVWQRMYDGKVIIDLVEFD